MTTYILAGGGDRNYPEYMVQLSRAVRTKIAKPRILSCSFASDDANMHVKFSRDKKMFEEHFDEIAACVLATKEDFVQQVRAADVVYFHGGRTNLLVDAMQAYPDIEKEFEGKIIVGSSAGANYLSSCGFSPSIHGVGRSSGIVDVAVVVHYGSPGLNGMTFDEDYWKQATEAVRKASGKKEIILLPEGTFTIIEQ